MSVADDAAARARAAVQALLVALVLVAPSALAQIGEAPETIVGALSDYGLTTTASGYRAAAGFEFALSEALGTAVAVTGEGSLTDANVRFLGALIGAASGYGSSLAGPVTDFFRSRSEPLAAAEEMVVQVQEYLLYLTFEPGSPPIARLRFAPQVVAEGDFGPAAHAIGPEDAPYVIREFTDLQCPFCAEFAARGMPIVRELLARGDVRFEVHHFPLKSVHPNATVAAEASECVAFEAAAAGGPEAGEDAFWTFAEALFVGQDRWSSLPDPLATFAQVAAENDLATEALAQCLRTGRFSALVEESYRVATQVLGLTGTPTLFVDGLMVGDYLDAADYERLLRLSDALAAVEDEGAAGGAGEAADDESGAGDPAGGPAGQ